MKKVISLILIASMMPLIATTISEEYIVLSLVLWVGSGIILFYAAYLANKERKKKF